MPSANSEADGSARSLATPASSQPDSRKTTLNQLLTVTEVADAQRIHDTSTCDPTSPTAVLVGVPLAALAADAAHEGKDRGGPGRPDGELPGVRRELDGRGGPSCRHGTALPVVANGPGTGGARRRAGCETARPATAGLLHALARTPWQPLPDRRMVSNDGCSRRGDGMKGAAPGPVGVGADVRKRRQCDPTRRGRAHHRRRHPLLQRELIKRSLERAPQDFAFRVRRRGSGSGRQSALRHWPGEILTGTAAPAEATNRLFPRKGEWLGVLGWGKLASFLGSAGVGGAGQEVA